MKNIGELIRQLETEYKSGSTTLSDYVQFSLKENINKIDAYANSKHTSGDKDSQGRDKPFFNIVTSAINIWYRATDIDRSFIRIRPSKLQDTIKATIATAHLQDWMRKARFGSFLNEWGRTLAKYGSAVVKFVEKEGELYSEVVSWHKLIIDPIDFDSAPVIEVLELTPAQLRKRKAYDQKVVEALIKSADTRETIEGEKQDNTSNYIRVYEIHGELPESLLEEDGDEDTYVQQMHVVSFVATETSDKKVEYEDFTLVKGRESKSPYMLTHLIKEDGRSQSIGAVEHLFESQWMVNHTKKAIKDQLDLASKLIFQTADTNFIGKNALKAIEQGDILVHDFNMPLTQVANNSHDITSLQSFGAEWKSVGNEITGISEAMLGVAPKSGTAWRQTEAILQESHDLFELMTENKGLAIEDMFRTYVLPYIRRRKLNSKDQILATLNELDIKKIDKKYIDYRVDKAVSRQVIDSLVRGEVPLPIDTAPLESSIQQGLSELGDVRPFSPDELGEKQWSDYFADMEWDLEVDVTGEGKDTQNMVTTLLSVLQFLANPQAMQNPAVKTVVSKVLNLTNAISPAEIAETVNSAPVALPEDTQLETNQ